MPRRLINACASITCLCLGAVGSLHGQQPPAQPPTSPAQPTAIDPPTDVSDALDRALTDLRIVEAQGPDRQDAFERVKGYLAYATRQDQYNRRARYYNARLYIAAGRREEALHVVQEWTGSPQGENDWEGHFILGGLYYEGTFYSLAKPVLEKALALNPREPRIHLELAKCEAKLMNPTGAVRRVQEAVALFGNDATAPVYVLLAQTRQQSGELEEAARDARYAVDLANVAIRRDGSTVLTLQALDQCLALSIQIKGQMLQANPGLVDIYLEISKLIQHRSRVAVQLADHQALGVLLQGLQSAGARPPAPLFVEAIRLLTKLGVNDQASSLAEQMAELYPANP